jgi:hypothetical protein
MKRPDVVSSYLYVAIDIFVNFEFGFFFFFFSLGSGWQDRHHHLCEKQKLQNGKEGARNQAVTRRAFHIHVKSEAHVASCVQCSERSDIP